MEKENPMWRPLLRRAERKSRVLPPAAVTERKSDVQIKICCAFELVFVWIAGDLGSIIQLKHGLQKQLLL